MAREITIRMTSGENTVTFDEHGKRTVVDRNKVEDKRDANITLANAAKEFLEIGRAHV